MSETAEHKIIHELTKEWAVDMLEALMDSAAKIGEASGESMRSFRQKTVLESGITTVLVDFKNSLRFFDMRKVTYENGRNIENLVAWLKDRNIQPKRPARTSQTEIELLNAAAWGMYRSKNKRFKRKKWLNSTMERQYVILMDKVSKLRLNMAGKTLINVLEQ